MTWIVVISADVEVAFSSTVDGVGYLTLASTVVGIRALGTGIRVLGAAVVLPVRERVSTAAVGEELG